MADQSLIINAVNLCLKKYSAIEFELNATGVCAGLDALYIKYALENKTAKFFAMLEVLSHLKEDSLYETDPLLVEFIAQIEQTYCPGKYGGWDIIQGDLDKFLRIQNQLVKNEFNFGSFAAESQWIEIIEKLTRNKRAYFIANSRHAISFSYSNNQYHLYDPNNPRSKAVLCDSAAEVIKKFKQSFEYTGDDFGLIIRAFAHPKDHTSPEYPTHELLHNLISKPQQQPHTDSGLFAAVANDLDTLQYVVKANAACWSSIGKYHLRPEVVTLLKKQPQSEEVNQAISTSIGINLSGGQLTAARELIDQYRTEYSRTEAEKKQTEKTLKDHLQQVLSLPIDSIKRLLREEPKSSSNQKTLEKSDYDWLLDECKHLKIDQEAKCSIAYIHLTILANLNRKPMSSSKQKLDQLSQAQLEQQIQFAAGLNHSKVLDQLFALVDKKESFTGIFNTNYIEHMNFSTVEKLINAGFVPDINNQLLLSQCLQRKNKQFFALIFKDLLQPNLNLSDRIGAISVLDGLVFLRSNYRVKLAWEKAVALEKIPSEGEVRNAWGIAINDGNAELSTFLQEKLVPYNNPLDQEALHYLFNQALKQKNLSTLKLLANLSFNIWVQLDKVESMMELCRDYRDFSLITSNFNRANSKIKSTILDLSIASYFKEIIDYCAEYQGASLFNIYLNEQLQKKGELKQLNQAVNKLKLKTLSVERKTLEAKKIIQEFLGQRLFSLFALTAPSVLWELEELKAWRTKLIELNNDDALVSLVKCFPELKIQIKKDEQLTLEQITLIEDLLKGNLFNSVIETIDDLWLLLPLDLAEKLITAAIKGNHKGLICKVMEQEVPMNHCSHILDALLEAVAAGHDQVIEPFVTMQRNIGLDFKILFIKSCEERKLKIANLLLVKDLGFSIEEIENTTFKNAVVKEIKEAMKKLFAQQAESPFELCYLEGYGRLYGLLLKAEDPNSRAKLLETIKNLELDPRLQKTALFLPLLRRAVKEEKKQIFVQLLAQTESVDSVNLPIYLKDPVIAPYVISFFLKNENLKALIHAAITKRNWEVAANLLQKYKLQDLDDDLLQMIKPHGDAIITAYIANLAAHYAARDVRPRLFDLLVTESSLILPTLASEFVDHIKTTLISIELKMIDQDLDLQNTIYRYQFGDEDTIKFFNKLHQCKSEIAKRKIDINQYLKDEVVLEQFTHIKELIANNIEILKLISEESELLINNLFHNSRLNRVCVLETQLYPLLNEKDANKEQLSILSKQLLSALDEAKLQESFVIPAIRSWLQDFNKKEGNNPVTPIQMTKSNALSTLKEQASKAIHYYIQNRNQHLNIFSYFFDFNRGKIRAEHYERLINNAVTADEVHVIEYALLINHKSKQINKDVANKLANTDPKTAINTLQVNIKNNPLFKEYLLELDGIIEAINNKANASKTEISFEEEIVQLRELIKTPRSLNQHSIFFTKNSNGAYKLWDWLNQLIYPSPKDYKLSSPSNRLSNN